MSEETKLAPTWRAMLPLLIHAIDHSHGGKALALVKLEQMAEAADLYNAAPTVTQRVGDVSVTAPYIVETLGKRDPL